MYVHFDMCTYIIDSRLACRAGATAPPPAWPPPPTWATAALTSSSSTPRVSCPWASSSSQPRSGGIFAGPSQTRCVRRKCSLNCSPPLSPFSLPFVSVYRVKSVRFQSDPKTKKKKDKSAWNCDGEVIMHNNHSRFNLTAKPCTFLYAFFSPDIAPSRRQLGSQEEADHSDGKRTGARIKGFSKEIKNCDFYGTASSSSNFRLSDK